MACDVHRCTQESSSGDGNFPGTIFHTRSCHLHGTRFSNLHDIALFYGLDPLPVSFSVDCFIVIWDALYPATDDVHARK